MTAEKAVIAEYNVKLVHGHAYGNLLTVLKEQTNFTAGFTDIKKVLGIKKLVLCAEPPCLSRVREGSFRNAQRFCPDVQYL